MGDMIARRIAAHSLLLADDEGFTLTSGQISNRFCDLKPAMFDPLTSAMITQGLIAIIEDLEPDFVGGLELGAVPLVSQVVAAAGDRLSGGFVVRKTPKGRGGRATGNPAGIEGVPIMGGGASPFSRTLQPLDVLPLPPQSTSKRRPLVRSSRSSPSSTGSKGPGR